MDFERNSGSRFRKEVNAGRIKYYFFSFGDWKECFFILNNGGYYGRTQKKTFI